MEQIAQQLKAEIESLQEYIQRTEERLQVSGWVSEILDPFELFEEDLDEEELHQVLDALHKAKYRFGVNGHLSHRIDAILDRHADSTPSLEEESAEDDSLPAKDLQLFGDESQEWEDEEPQDNQATDPDQLFRPFDFAVEDATSPFEPIEQAAEEEEEDLFADDDGDERDFAPDELFDLPPDQGGLFSGEETEKAEDLFAEEASSSQEPVKSQNRPRTTRGGTDGLSPDTLFSRDRSPEMPPSREKQEKTSKTPSRLQQQEKHSSKVRHHQPLAQEEEDQRVDIFSAKVSIDDLSQRLDIGIPPEDRTQLQNLLHNKVSDRVAAALQRNELFENQFILVPRIPRFIHRDTLYPCTVKNMARTFIALFGEIRDLMQYREKRFLSGETPELGWSLITPEAPRETLDKNFMEQTQYLRYLAATVGIPSHLVRRRTLVEAIYDIIVGRLVLGEQLQRQTLDWTGTAASKNDYVCVFYADNGIRLRDLPRTTQNSALGAVANW